MNDSIISAIEARRTVNLFDTAHIIDEAQIVELIRLATTAPSAFNLQNWRFIAAHSAHAKARLRQLAWDQAKVTEAAVTFIVCGQLADHRTLAERLAPAVDAGVMPAQMVPGWEGAAKNLYHDQPLRQRDEAIRTATFGAGTLIYAAQAMGLGSSPMIGFDAEAVAEAFALAADEIPVMLVAVGQPAPENWPRKPRRPLAQVLSVI